MSRVVRVFIEPTDVLIFRTGLPFDAGANSYAPSIFPPSPEPLQGALREYLARALANGRTLEETFKQEKELLGDREQPGRFRMHGPFLACRRQDAPDVIERLYPPPADLLRNQEGIPHLVQPIKPDEDKTILTNLPPTNAPLWRLVGYEQESPFTNWLSADELTNWQAGNVAKIKGIKPSELWETEPRFGIKHQRGTKVVEEGFLYQLEFVRLKPGVGLDVDVWFEDDKQPAPDLAALLAVGWGRLGGEGRTARYTVSHPAPALPLPSGMRRTRLYLATPTVFADGWQSKSWSSLVGAASLVTAAVPRYLSIGGWSMRVEDQGGTHKVMRRYVPAGSVYYFDDAISNPPQLVDDPIKKLIGYGVCYAGAW